jgi:hypothetical protein
MANIKKINQILQTDISTTQHIFITKETNHTHQLPRIEKPVECGPELPVQSKIPKLFLIMTYYSIRVLLARDLQIWPETSQPKAGKLE